MATEVSQAHDFIDTSIKKCNIPVDTSTIAGHVNPQNLLEKIGTVYPPDKCYCATSGILRIVNYNKTQKLETNL